MRSLYVVWQNTVFSIKDAAQNTWNMWVVVYQKYVKTRKKSLSNSFSTLCAYGPTIGSNLIPKNDYSIWVGNQWQAIYYIYNRNSCIGDSWHDNVIRWKHFPRYWPFVRGTHPWPVKSTHKGGALLFSLICVWINGWANSRYAGDLRRHGAYYDVTLMVHRRYASL